MITGMKNKLVACCFCALLFLLSGCVGMDMGGTGPVESSRTDILQKILANAEQPGDTKNVTVESVPEDAAEPVPPKKIVPAEKIPPVSEKVDRSQPDSRFENAKKRLESFGRTPPEKKQSKAGGIAFNFDNADLYEVVRTMAEILDINYMVEPGINGRVTIHTAGELHRSDLFPLFFQILELNGLSAVKEGDIYRIVRGDKITTTPLPARYGRDPGRVPDQERMVMQIIPLQHVSAEAIIPTVTPFLSGSGKILPQPGSDLFIVIDKNNNLQRILQLVDIFDVDLFDNISHRFFRLQNTAANDALGLVRDLIEPYLKVDRSDFKMISIQRLNTLVAISKNERILDKIDYFIKKIDIQENSAEPRIFIYKVRNSDAKDLASLLNQVFANPEIKPSDQARENGKKASEADSIFQSSLNKKEPEKSPPTVPAENAGMAGGASLSRSIRVIPDTIRNALIIEAVPFDYAMVKTILEELDVLPRQVLIDVLILDVNISGNRNMGVEWSFLKDRPGGESGLLTATAGSEGLTFTAGITDDWRAAVKMLAAEGRADVLSAPSVLASDNKPATINVVTQIPVATSTFDVDDGVTTTSIQYRDTGIILSVTPHINDDGMVSMEISQEVSSVADTSTESDAPAFFNRNVTTSLSVKNRQTIVIGGLISQTKSDNISGVPGLSKLPVIGFIFGNKKDEVVKNELIIMITPRVINNLSDIDSVSNEFKSKFSDLQMNTKKESDLVSD